MKNLSFFLILLLAAAKPSMGQGQVDTILNRYCRYLYQTEHPRSTDIDHWVRTISGEGRWPDINYTDEHRANWQLWTHLKRLDQLSVAWRNPASSFYHDDKVWKAINLALDDWLQHRYQNPNWWHNQIGVPQCMRDIIILLRDTLSAKQLKGALAVMAQLHVQKSGAGANLIWSADLGFHYGALTGDEALMDSCRKLIVEEIHISTGEGIQPDYSFHQHGSRLQMYQYGKAFLFSNIRLGWELHGTRWAYPPSRIRILRDFLLKGWQWMARGVNTVPGTMDRSASRVGELRSPDIRYLIPFLCELDPGDAPKFKTLADHQNGKGALSGFRYYPYSDFTAYQRRGFSFFLKTISTRTLPTEVGLNAENLKGRLLNSGDGYLIRDGKEYYNLMPVWDWQKLPGTTGFKDAYKIDRQPFCGSVTGGQSGLSAMDYGLKDSTGKKHMSAHKIWACHQNMVVCLVADLKADNIPGGIYTVLDQCRRQGPVMVNRPDHVIGEGIDQLSGVKWIYHAGFAYFLLKPARVALKLGEVKGKWSVINKAQPDSLVSDRIFMPVMLSDTDAGELSTGYVLARCSSPREAMKLSRKSAWKILSNDNRCQAVKFSDGDLMGAFFTADSMRTRSRLSLAVDRPCLILIKGKTVYASDPLHKGGILHVLFNSRRWRVTLPQDGTTVKGIAIRQVSATSPDN